MELNDIYDNQGQDGIDNEKAFKRLPSIAQYFISSSQKMLVDKVRRSVEKEYGEVGVRDLVKTSGFRSHAVNVRYNGVNDSLHLWGLAVDFRKCGLFASKPIPVCCNLELIDSGSCWHVQYKRG